LYGSHIHDAKVVLPMIICGISVRGIIVGYQGLSRDQRLSMERCMGKNIVILPALLDFLEIKQS
jgi:hypothetical protein